MDRIDPLSDKFPSQSPYVTSGNSPIRYYDKEGMEQWDGMMSPTTYWYNRIHNPDVLTYSEYSNNDEYAGSRKLNAAVGGGVLAVTASAEVVAYYGIEASVGFVCTEVLEEGAERILNVPLLLDPVDIGQQLVKKSAKFGSDVTGTVAKKARGWEGRLAAYKKYSPNWAKGSQSEALEKFAPGIKGITSTDGVKTSYFNPKTNIEVKVDNENSYFRISNTKTGQELNFSGTEPKVGHLKGKAASDYRKSQTHIKNTDK